VPATTSLLSESGRTERPLRWPGHGTTDTPLTTAIEVVVEEGDGWSEPTTVVDTDGWFDGDPAIAPLGDGWVVAWERSATDSDATAVGYAVLDAAGAVERSETVSQAGTLAVGTTGESVVLAYADQAAGQVRRDLVASDGRTTDRAYDVAPEQSVADLAVAGTQTAWLTSGREITAGFYADGPEVEQLEFVSRESSLSRLGLVETDAGTVLTAARVPETDVRSRSLVYRVRDGETWRPEQVPAIADASADVTVRSVATAPVSDGNGLRALVEARAHDPDAVSDIAAIKQPLRPSYAVTAESDRDTARPREDVTISFDVENTGDLDGTAIGRADVAVEARSRGETVAEESIEPLDRGETSSGELTVTVDETGTVDLVVGRELSLLDPAERRTTVEVATPELAVESVVVDRESSDSAVATIAIRNGGLATASEVPIEVIAGDGTVLGTPAVPGPAPGAVEDVTVAFDPTAIPLETGEQIRVDPDGVLPDSHVTERVSSVLLGQPDVPVGAVPADATPGDGSFADEDLLAVTAVSVPPAVGDAEQSVTVSLDLDDVTYGQELRYVLTSNRPAAGAGVPVVYDRVGPFGEGSDGPEFSARDPDGDGLYEDVDDSGGEPDIFDVRALFNNLDDPDLQADAEYFDFDDSGGEVDIFDVRALFNELSEN